MLKDKYEFKDLLEIMELLRGPQGCPWDREQTHDSIKRYMIEETYEVLEQIEKKDSERLSDELGDLLLQVVFHAQIRKENGGFDMSDVVSGICRKLISRHTHVFGEASADTPDQVVENWEEIKKKEKGIESHTGVLKDVPSNLPALMRSFKVQQKAARVGFDWERIEDVFDKVYEELQEIKDVYKSNNMERISEEMGDALFALVNLSRFLEVHPELALTGTTNKFIKRFEYIESEGLKKGKRLEDMNLREMDELWNEAKRHSSEK
jgi:tetrapyrrole methylase family protein/MazG family protein